MKNCINPRFFVSSASNKYYPPLDSISKYTSLSANKAEKLNLSRVAYWKSALDYPRYRRSWERLFCQIDKSIAGHLQEVRHNVIRNLFSLFGNYSVFRKYAGVFPDMVGFKGKLIPVTNLKYECNTSFNCL